MESGTHDTERSPLPSVPSLCKCFWKLAHGGMYLKIPSHNSMYSAQRK